MAFQMSPAYTTAMRPWTVLAIFWVAPACHDVRSLSAHVGSAAPEFVLPDLLEPGRSVEIRPGVVTLVDFWATWCRPCTRALPTYETLLRTRPGVTLLALSEDPSAAEPKRFLARRDMSALASSERMQFAHDSGARVARRFSIRGIPTLFVVDEGGAIAAVHVGFEPADAARLAQELDALSSAARAD